MEEHSRNNGVLFVMMEPPPDMDREFQAWYDTLHVPLLRSIDGFLTGLRFICITGWPRSLAVYDLTSIDVLESPAYVKPRFEQQSPWSKRILASVLGLFRGTGTQLYPGKGVTGGRGPAARLVVWRFRHDSSPSQEASILDGLEALYEGKPETVQVRLFDLHDGDMRYYLAIVESQVAVTEVDVGVFGAAAATIDLMHVYVPYQR